MVCPVCILGAIGGVALARYFGVNDLIIGVWLGALTAAMLFYFNTWLIKRYGKWHKYQTPVFLLITLIVLSVVLYYTASPVPGVCA